MTEFTLPFANMLLNDKEDRRIILDMDGTLGDNIPTHLQKQIPGVILETEPIARPYLDLFIKYLFKRNFKVSIWTAGAPAWFKKFYTKVIEPCMPPGKILEFVYTRNDYDYMRGVKSLSQIYANHPEYNPGNTIIIDDNPVTFSDNEENAIAIIPFFYDLIDPKYRDTLETYDYELLKLIKVLERKISGEKFEHDILMRDVFVQKTQEENLRELEELKSYVNALLE